MMVTRTSLQENIREGLFKENQVDLWVKALICQLNFTNVREDIIFDVISKVEELLSLFNSYLFHRTDTENACEGAEFIYGSYLIGYSTDGMIEFFIEDLLNLNERSAIVMSKTT